MSDDPLLPYTLLLILLLLLHAFFSAAQAALESLSEARVKKQIEDGDRHAEKLLRLLQAPEWTLSALQICSTLAGLLSAACAAHAFSPAVTRRLAQLCETSILSETSLSRLVTLGITLLLSYFILVLGILAPRRAALQAPDAAARLTAGVVCVLSTVLRPMVWLLTVSTNAVLRLLRLDPHASVEQVSEDEIRMMVDLGEEHGAIESAEKELIENIFEFNNTTAGDVMVHRTDMEMLWVEDSAEEILATIQSSGLSRFPVYNEDADDVIGILNTRDYLLNTQLSRPKPFRSLLRAAYFVPESVRTDVLFRDMQSKKVHMAIVVDEYGGTSGLVTMEDLLEEIVGNIYDEFDPQEDQEIEQVGENLWRVSGSTELETLAEVLDVTFSEEEESDTLGGLVFAQLSVIPEDGSTFEVDACGLHIQITEFTDRRVEQAMVSKTTVELNDDANED